MEDQKTETISGDDRLFSLISHLAFFIGSFIVPLVIWIIYKDKSKFVRFNSLQAVFLQGISAFFVSFAVFNATIIIEAGKSGARVAKAFTILFPILLALSVFLLLGMTVYAVYAGVKSYKGEIVKYPVIGNIIYNKVYKD